MPNIVVDQRGHERTESTLLLAALLHQLSKIGVDASLISGACGFHPRHDIGIQPNRHSGLLGPVKPANHGIRWNLANLGDVGQVDVTVRPRGKLLKLPAFLNR